MQRAFFADVVPKSEKFFETENLKTPGGAADPAQFKRICIAVMTQDQMKEATEGDYGHAGIRLLQQDVSAAATAGGSGR